MGAAAVGSDRVHYVGGHLQELGVVDEGNRDLPQIRGKWCRAFRRRKLETLVHDLSGDKTLQLSCRASHGDLRLTVRIWLGLHRRLRKAAIQITPAHKRPPVIEKNFEGPPICNPA